MVEKIRNSKFMILLLLTGAVYFFLQYLVPLLAPVLTAMLFVTIFGPTLQKMQQKLHVHRQVGVVLLLLVAGLLGAGLLWVLFSWAVGSLPEWIAGLDALEMNLTVIVHEGCNAVGNILGINQEYLEETLLRGIQRGIDSFQLQVVPDMLSQSFTYVKVAGRAGGFLVTFLIATILLAKDYDCIMNWMLEKEECHVLLEIICGIIRYIATFIKAQLIIMSVIGLTAALTLGIAGVRQGPLWGLLAGLLDALPFVGTGIVLMPLLVAQLFCRNYGQAIVCAVLYVVCVFLREIMEPRLIGRCIGVTPIAILVSLYAGIQLFGIWGIIKGPLGFMIIYQAYRSIQRRNLHL